MWVAKLMRHHMVMYMISISFIPHLSVISTDIYAVAEL